MVDRIAMTKGNIAARKTMDSIWFSINYMQFNHVTASRKFNCRGISKEFSILTQMKKIACFNPCHSRSVPPYFYDMLQNNKKIYQLESMRGLAALLIVIYHIDQISLWNSFFDFEIIKNGYLMVEVFFVLSGFVIYKSYSGKITNADELMKFQCARFSRLYPVHLFFLFVYLLTEIIKYFIEKNSGIVNLGNHAFSTNNSTAFIQQFFLLQAIGPTGNTFTFNGPAWSISVEFYTYLLFGFIVLFLKDLKQYMFFVISMVSILLLVNKNTFGFESLLRCHAGFFLGCLVAHFEKSTKNLPGFSALAAFAAILLFLIFKVHGEHDHLIYFLSVLLIIALTSSNDCLFSRIMKLNFLIWLGTISYSVYMSHYIVILITNKIMLKIKERIHGVNYLHHFSLLEAYAIYIVNIIIVLVVGFIVHRCIEKPFQEKYKKFAGRWQVAS